MLIRPVTQRRVDGKAKVERKSKEKQEETKKTEKFEKLNDLEDALGQDMATEEGETAQKKDPEEKEAEDGEDEGRESDEGEEGREPQRLPIPQKVTSRERKIHELTHTPYRLLCKYCVRARGKNMAHRAGHDDDDEAENLKVPRCSMDCFFMSK